MSSPRTSARRTKRTDLQSQYAGNDLTATVNGNRGCVTSPSQAIDQDATDGATISVTENGNRIVVRS